MAKPQNGKLAHVNACRHDERETQRAEAWALRLEGHPVRAIAERLGCSVSTAHEYLRTTLAELRETALEGADNWRRLELERLEGMLAHWLPISKNPGHVECARAAVICLRAIELQAKLTGVLTSTMLPGGGGQAGKKPITLAELAAEIVSSPELATAFERELAAAKRVTPAAPAEKEL